MSVTPHIQVNGSLGVVYEPYLVGLQWEDKPLANWWGEALVGLDEGAGVLSDVSDVEQLVEAAVLVGDQVAYQVAGVLVCVDVVEQYQCIPIETGGDGLSCRSVDDVKEGLEQNFWVHHLCVFGISGFAFRWRTYGVILIKFQAAPPGDASEVGRGQFDHVQFERLFHKHDVVLAHAEAVEVAGKQGGADGDGADLLNLPQRRLPVLFI